MCITKLDVLDGLPALRIGVAYRTDGKTVTTSPVGADLMERCEPEYIEMPGWTESTVGAKSKQELPAAAQDYLARIEELSGVPIDIISTGPDRADTVILRHPFSDG